MSAANVKRRTASCALCRKRKVKVWARHPRAAPGRRSEANRVLSAMPSPGRAVRVKRPESPAWEAISQTALASRRSRGAW